MATINITSAAMRLTRARLRVVKRRVAVWPASMLRTEMRFSRHTVHTIVSSETTSA